jgi:hypothetical protein
VLSSVALVVAIFGSTSFGRAAIDAAVPLAKRAYLADTAKNAIKVDNIKASRTPTPGMLLPLDAGGKLPESIGAVGPVGPAGPKGDKGDSGATKVVVRSQAATITSAADFVSVACQGDEKVVGGGAYASGYPVTASYPGTIGGSGVPSGSPAPAWVVRIDPEGSAVSVSAIALCASP